MSNDGERADELPDAEIVGVALAAVLMELERKFPGIIDRARRRVAASALLSVAIPIRGRRLAPGTRDKVQAGLAWLKSAGEFAEAELGPVGKHGKRRKG